MKFCASETVNTCGPRTLNISCALGSVPLSVVSVLVADVTTISFYFIKIGIRN